TAATIEKELESMGLAHTRTAVTGVYTDIRGNLPGDKTIVLRADIDALPVTEEHECEYRSTIPGKMHACGHDAHTASLLTAVHILRDHRDLFGGTVRAVFQPGEEIGYGGRIVVDEGVVDGADRTFGLHVAPYVPVGQVMIAPGPNCASVDWFRIKVRGKSAHVSTPEQGVDALYIASQIVVAVQALVTRRTSPVDSALIGIGKLESGTAYNVVASEAVMEGTVRVFLPEIRKKIHDQMEQLAALTAQTYGGTVEIKWKDFTSPLLNDEVSSLEAQKTAAALFGEKNVKKSRTPSLGGDDFAEFILRVPGVYAFVGSGNVEIPETMAAQHNSHFDIDEKALEISAALYAAYAMDFLNGEV
ncbi:MAG: amidohydrolase, partial [Clostridiales bacterium]|nr:amidohydrolase [Clostridiales bacterium]